MILAVVLIQLLALGHFFLAIVGIMNDSLPAFIILLVIGLLWECLFIHFVRKIRKQKSDQSGADLQADAPKVFAENLYDDHGLNYIGACEQYCRQHGKTEKDLTKEEKNIVWQYAYDDFTYLLMWIIENGFYQPSEELEEEDAKEAKALAAKIKRREETPAVFLSDNDGVFLKDEIKKKARSFVIEYFNGSYMDGLRAFAKEVLQAEIHGFPFRWEDYDAFKVYIDQAYAEYLKKNSSKNTIEEK